MSWKINIDGELCQAEHAKISVLDRGFLYGDSVYEVVRTYGSRIFALDEHLARLTKSASRLELDLPKTSWLREQIEKTIAATENEECYCRIVVTRGTGPITLDPSTADKPCTVIIAKDLELFPDWQYTQGIKVTIPMIRRNSRFALDPAIKSGNYLNSILALGEAMRAGFDDALMICAAGRVTEATTSNVFTYHSDTLRTPALETGILEGVTRGFVLDLATKLGIRWEECELYPEDLISSDEVMLTSTLKEVMPVVQIGSDTINTGKPGPIAKKLREAFQIFARERVQNGA